MNILLTGVTGYIGKRVLIALLQYDHVVYCSVRDVNRLDLNLFKNQAHKIRVLQNDFLKPETLENIPNDIDAAYYLVHSMSSDGDFMEKERLSAENFKQALEKTRCRQVIFLTGIVNEEVLSDHLKSRKTVEDTLQSSSYALTSLRAGIVVGSGSASFEIIRDLVEKLPIMIAPIWLRTRCSPIGIRNVIQFLIGVLGKEFTYNKEFDISSGDVLTYKQMLMGYARVRNLRRSIFTVPVMTPKLSSYWLYFITSTSYSLAVHLVDSMKIDVIARPNELASQLGIRLYSYEDSIRQAFDKIKQNDVLSSWYDSFTNPFHQKNIWQYVEVPEMGTLSDKKQRKIVDEAFTINQIFSIGGKNGWYYGDFLWRLRGLSDKMVGGVGLRRGRRNASEISAGDSLDFWRVLYSSKEEKRLLLFAEMKLPGEAWLEWKIQDGVLFQTATFRPHGIAGRLYWYAVLPFHYFIFNGMIDALVKENKESKKL